MGVYIVFSIKWSDDSLPTEAFSILPPGLTPASEEMSKLEQEAEGGGVEDLEDSDEHYENLDGEGDDEPKEEDLDLD